MRGHIGGFRRTLQNNKRPLIFSEVSRLGKREVLNGLAA